jgi:signal transduction histidine kinase/ligand-binding sensor domain-containing protein
MAVMLAEISALAQVSGGSIGGRVIDALGVNMEPGRTLFRRSATAVLAVALLARCAFALNPSLDISQFSHASWKVDEGFSKGVVRAIAQTPDGYLWLGTEYGLLRFDGVQRVPWPIDESLPSTDIQMLIGARDGTLWIGTSKGLASMRAGSLHLNTYPELNGQSMFGLAEDQGGNIWAAGWSARKVTVCSIGKGGVECDAKDAPADIVAGALYRDRKENIWVGVANGVWRWSPGPPSFYSLPGETGFDSLAEDGDGALLFGLQGGIRRLSGGHVELVHLLPPATHRFHVRRILRDRDGGLWTGTAGGGLVHIHEGGSEVFTRTEGLSGDDVTAIFEDREGTIWVGTINGLDRFRETPVTTYSERQGLSSARIVSVLVAQDGSIWMRTLDGLTRWKDGLIAVYRERNHVLSRVATGQESARTLSKSEFPEQGAGSVYQDLRGRVWVTTPGAVGYFESERFVQVPAIPGGRVRSIVGDRAGSLWFAHQERGLIRWEDGRPIQQTAWSAFGDTGFADALATDPKEGGLWIGFFRGGLLYVQDGKILRSYTSADGLGEGRVNDFRIEADGTLWITTEGGLTRLKNGRLATLTMKNGLPCNKVHWSIEDDLHSVWLYTACGLLRIPRSELDASVSEIEKDRNAPVRIQPAIFDNADGLRSRANAGGFSPHVSESADGRLWFFPLDGLSSVDPARLALDSSPPPVHIEQLRADRRTHLFSSDPDARFMLPPLVRDLEIEYTAIHTTAPEKVRFRYMLEGRDHEWTDAGVRRQVFYNDLPPGNYRFRVNASATGVSNESGALLDFRIAPAYYQTRWFQATCLMAFVTTLGMLYQFRLRQVARHFRMRMEERVSERTRIARDLHDTLLQSLQALLLNFHSVTYLLPDRPEEARDALETAIENTRHAITEGRNAVEGLRSVRHEGPNLEATIGRLSHELAAHHSEPACPDVHVNVEGATRSLAPIVGNEVDRIAIEALRNAFLHAGAQHIEVEIWYHRQEFRLRVRDNGKGIDPKILQNGRDGHYGITGMYERAKLVRGRLVFWSEIGSGTELELTVPASLAYTSGPNSRPPAFSAPALLSKLRRILS